MKAAPVFQARLKQQRYYNPVKNTLELPQIRIFVGKGSGETASTILLLPSKEVTTTSFDVCPKSPIEESQFLGTAISSDRLPMPATYPVSHEEMWVFDSPEILRGLQDGLREAAEGKLKDLGDFSCYLDEDLE